MIAFAGPSISLLQVWFLSGIVNLARRCLLLGSMTYDPFQLLGVEPGCDFATISAAHAARCRERPDLRQQLDRALLDLLQAAQAQPSVAEPTEDIPSVLTETAGAEAVVVSAADERPPRKAVPPSRAAPDPHKVLASLERTLASNPQNIEAYVRRGLLYAEELQRPDLALRDFTVVIELAPRSARGFLLRGRLYAEKLAEPRKALADFDEAIRLEPGMTEAYVLRGHVHHGLNDLKKALADYTCALGLGPEDAAVYRRRARVYMDLGRLEEARTDLTMAIKLDPKDVQAYLDRAMLWQQLGRLDQAIVDYNAAVQIAPDLPEAYYGRGKAFLAQGKAKLARQDFERALKLQEAIRSS